MQSIRNSLIEVLPENVGKWTHEVMSELFFNARSIVGPQIKADYRQLAKGFRTKPNFISFKSGRRIESWEVPEEWKLNRAYLKCVRSEKIIVDTDECNLYLWSHSKPFVGRLDRDELLATHVKSHPVLNDAIPYITTYYEDTWGFSIPTVIVDEMCEGPFDVKVDTELKPGSLEIMEVVLPGKSKTEILFSTYLCHPSMANNELSGPVLMMALINYLEKLPRNYTYRFVMAPETIGSICYTSGRRGKILSKKNLHAFNLTCVGGSTEWSLLTSRLGDTYTDFVAKFILLNSVKAFKEYDYLSRGSDERQYCTPKIGINMVSIMRSKYYEYPEYHTNLDNLLFVTHQTLQTTFDLYKILLDSLESDGKIRTKLTHEPYLNVLLEKPELGGQLHTVKPFRRQILDFIAYSDGRSFLEILEITQIGLSEGIKVLEFLLSKQAIQKELF